MGDWLKEEVHSIPDKSYRRVIFEVNANLDKYVTWADRAELLWEGCHRIKYHRYPKTLTSLIQQHDVKVNRLSNGPAIIAYLLTGGERPKRNGRHHWTIHHLYDGKFPYPGNTRPSICAVKNPRHFTQSAGVVAVHPIADALAEEFEAFAWTLRAESFKRFGYDPEGAFSATQNRYGFAHGYRSKIWYRS